MVVGGGEERAGEGRAGVARSWVVAAAAAAAAAAGEKSDPIAAGVGVVRAHFAASGP
eukprot:SAG31_NODE_18_length_35375_cov_22.525315_5_plen_57_part_00